MTNLYDDRMRFRSSSVLSDVLKHLVRYERGGSYVDGFVTSFLVTALVWNHLKTLLHW